MVIAVPAALTVERDEEQVRPCECVEPRARVVHLQHGVAERAAETLEHGGRREEADVARRQPGEAFEVEVVRDEPLLSARGPGRTVGDGERGEEGARGPALHPLPKRTPPRLRQLHPRRAEQQVLLALGQRKLLGPQLEQTPGRACACDPEAEAAAGKDERRSVGHVLREHGEQRERPARAEDVDVVQHERDRPFGREQCGSEPRGGGASAGARQAAERKRRECPGNVALECGRIVVRVVERQPGDRPPVARRPLPEQRRLAVARGSENGRKRGGRGPQAVDEGRPRDGVRPQHRLSQLQLARFAGRTASHGYRCLTASHVETVPPSGASRPPPSAERCRTSTEAQPHRAPQGERTPKRAVVRAPPTRSFDVRNEPQRARRRPRRSPRPRRANAGGTGHVSAPGVPCDGHGGSLDSTGDPADQTPRPQRVSGVRAA